jgi:PhzF family phenazine biosynthesis protein
LIPAGHPFQQVDVFTATPYLGNPVAVVLDADGLPAEQMQRFAAWTNLSEAAFLLRPTSGHADYRVRIFTSSAEVAFAGHPTLGACHAWLAAGGEPAGDEEIVQECGVGRVPIRRSGHGLSFAAPPLIRSDEVDASIIERIAGQLGIDRDKIIDSRLLDNGLAWFAVLLESAEAVRALRPGGVDLDIGVVGPYPAGSEVAFEVRAFFPKDASTAEDPVTGSLNASLAQWLLATGRATAPYVASQGGALGRAGRVHVSQDRGGSIWVGGRTVTCVSGHVEL